MAFHQNLSQELSSLHHFATDQQPHHPPPPNLPEAPGGGPNWLNTALLRAQDTTSSFLNLHTAANNSDVSSPHGQSPSAAQWLSRSSSSRFHHQQHHHHRDAIDDVAGADSILAVAAMSSPAGADLKQTSGGGDILNAANKGDGVAGAVESGSSGGGGEPGMVNWQNARHKAEILSHPLYDQLLNAHVSCLRIATPVDQLPRIDAQLAQSQNVVAKYSHFGGGPHHGLAGDDKELDHFMTHYFLLLCSFKEQLQQHVRVHAMEAVMACWEIEQSLQSLTGVPPGEGTGATMSEDEDDQADSDTNVFDHSLDGTDSMGFGPLIPTESERSLMERVRQELKHELKQGYKDKIFDIREEILRKRRAGKLPGDTTSVLKAWWQSHSKWPYPTEEDKAKLVQETGLQLKQINNWFINQRKRNWHSNPSSSTVLKSKRKR